MLTCYLGAQEWITPLYFLQLSLPKASLGLAHNLWIRKHYKPHWVITNFSTGNVREWSHLLQNLREYHAHYKNPQDLSTIISLGKKYATGNQMRWKKKKEWRKGQRKWKPHWRSINIMTTMSSSQCSSKDNERRSLERSTWTVHDPRWGGECPATRCT